MTYDQCVDVACELFSAYDGAFPPWWGVIDNDLERLLAIFRFFCRMRALEEAARAQPSPLFDLLESRLRARVERGVTGADLPQPNGPLRRQIEGLSRDQLDAMALLGSDLGHAFDLFASGSLTFNDYVLSVLPPEAEPLDPPEPDSGYFFFWTEFGLLACDAGVDPDRWLAAMPVLLRSLRIFIRCYGSLKDGHVRPGMCWDWYTRGRPGRTFVPIDPTITMTTEFRFELVSRDEFDRAATRLAQMGLPGGMDSMERS